jgi:hypothetical protein
MKPTSFHAAATRRRDSVRHEGGAPQLDRQAGQSAAQDAVHIPKNRVTVIDPQIRRAIDQLQMPGTELHVSRTS